MEDFSRPRRIPRLNDQRLPERFWRRVRRNPKTRCWEWQGPLTDQGYPVRVHVSGSGENRVVMSPQRWAYTVLIGPINEETLNHDCYVRHCVNPGTGHAHTPMSAADNVREGKARITHCPAGHEYTPENTIMVGSNKNRRGCRTCYNDRSREYWHTTRKATEKAARRAAGYRGGVTETSTCLNGHERNDENTRIRPDGYEACRPCGRAANARFEAKKSGRATPH